MLPEELENNILRSGFDSCWYWTGALFTQGYRQVCTPPFRNKKAHRVIYELIKGPVPEGLWLDHLCRKRNCVNPNHLEPVTHRENTLRGVGISALNAKKTHCVAGHEFTAENTYERTANKDGVRGRGCRECHRRRSLAYLAKKRGI